MRAMVEIAACIRAAPPPTDVNAAVAARHSHMSNSWMTKQIGLSFGFEAGDARYVRVHEPDLDEEADANSRPERSSPIGRKMFTSPSLPTNVVVVVVEGTVSGPVWPGAVIRIQLLGAAAPTTALCSLKSSFLGPGWSMFKPKRTDKCWATLSPDLGIRRARQQRCLMGGVHHFFVAHDIRYVQYFVCVLQCPRLTSPIVVGRELCVCLPACSHS